MKHTSAWVIAGLTGLAHVGLYLAFAANVGGRELGAAVLVGGVAATAALVVSAAGDVRFRFRPRDVLQAWRMPWYAVAGTGQVLRALGQQLFTAAGAPSILSAVRFDMGDPHDLSDAGRRALAVTYTTATPNFVILGLVDEQQLMLFHQVAPADVNAMTRRLGARP